MECKKCGGWRVYVVGMNKDEFGRDVKEVECKECGGVEYIKCGLDEYGLIEEMMKVLNMMVEESKLVDGMVGVLNEKLKEYGEIMDYDFKRECWYICEIWRDDV